MPDLGPTSSFYGNGQSGTSEKRHLEVSLQSKPPTLHPRTPQPWDSSQEPAENKIPVFYLSRNNEEVGDKTCTPNAQEGVTFTEEPVRSNQIRISITGPLCLSFLVCPAVPSNSTSTQRGTPPQIQQGQESKGDPADSDNGASQWWPLRASRRVQKQLIFQA